ncbi:MAG: hypothetical protein JXA94_03570 [Parachlamydiales bacterium]|nr:hypothetical protein [Parachlamydiales bacterium]
MDTFFYVNAKNLTESSVKDCENKNYFESWNKTILARVNFLADSIINTLIIPFTTLKILFHSLTAIYTWGYEITNLTNAIKELKNNINHSFGSFVGLFSTKLALDIRKSEIIETLSAVAATAIGIAFIFTMILKVTGYFAVCNAYPMFYWEPGYFMYY